MKQSQMLFALVALLAMVFVITLMMNYSPVTNPPVQPPITIGAGKTKSAEDESDLWLRLHENSYPAIPLGGELQQAPPVEVEHGKADYHDFWFINENSIPIKTGLYSVSCSCSRMEAFIMSESWKERWLKVRTDARAAPSSGSDKELLEMEQTALPINLEADTKKEVGATIPPGAIGKFRMHWNGQKTGVQRITSKMWSGQPRNIKGELSIYMVYRDPLRIAGRDYLIELGELNRDQLPSTRSIYLWSSTRDSLPLKAELADQAGVLGSDPVQVATPIPLSAAECQNLEQEHLREAASNPLADVTGSVRSAVRLDVTAKKTGADGKTLIEIGTFRRTIKISGQNLGPALSIVAEGTVNGDVQRDERGPVKFESVTRSKGDSKTIMLRSDVPGLELELDQTRLRAFLKAELGKAEIKKEGATERSRSWRLTIEVLPNRGYGSFPREEPATYRDCAVYLRLMKPGVASDAPREYLRVPVQGLIKD